MDVRHLSFRLLQVFVEVARVGNISAAARALHLTQPTVSLQLKKLGKRWASLYSNSATGACG
jgi:DNA-binding transcriptional LysR family regulator